MYAWGGKKIRFKWLSWVDSFEPLSRTFCSHHCHVKAVQLKNRLCKDSLFCCHVYKRTHAHTHCRFHGWVNRERWQNHGRLRQKCWPGYTNAHKLSLSCTQTMSRGHRFSQFTHLSALRFFVLVCENLNTPMTVLQKQETHTWFHYGYRENKQYECCLGIISQR